jgi:hypothetical protein
MSPWVTEYLYSIYVLELPYDEEKKLTKHCDIIACVLREKLPHFVSNLVSVETSGLCLKGKASFGLRKFMVSQGKTPRRGGGERD